MKKHYLPNVVAFLTLLIVLVPDLSLAQCACDHVISAGNSQWYFDGIEQNVQPGDTICLASGTKKGIQLRNIQGTPENPVIITNMCDGKVFINPPQNYGNAIEVNNCQYIHMTGSANPNEAYGIEITGVGRSVGSTMGINFQKLTTDVEADHIYIHDIGCVGIVAKTDPTCDTSTWRGNFTMENLYFHHNKIEDAGCEGFYIGNSHYSTGRTLTCNGTPTLILEHDMYDVEVAYNTVTNIGNDAIQVGSVLNGMRVHHNVVDTYALNGTNGHGNGIQVGSGSNGVVYNNIVKNGGQGVGYAFFDKGRGNTRWYNNLADNCHIGFLVDDNPPFLAGGNLYANNLLINVSVKYIDFYSTQTDVSLFANTIFISNLNPSQYHSFYNGSQSLFSESNNIFATDVNLLNFSDPLSGDYHPTATSPAVNAGLDFSGNGDSIVFDLGDMPRVWLWDIGPYEYPVPPAPPVADAGSDTSTLLPTVGLVLTGTASDPDGTLASTVWTQQSGPPATLLNDSTPDLTVMPQSAGVFTFRLTVTDNDGFTAFDEVEVIVSQLEDLAQFNFTTDPLNLPGWNDLAGHPHEGVIAVTDPVTGISVTSVSPDQWNPLDIGGGMFSTSYPGGVTNGTVRPAAVMNTYWFDKDALYGSMVNGVVQLDNVRITNLDPTHHYELTLGASRAGSTPRVAEFRINQTETMNLAVNDNSTDQLLFTEIRPDTAGVIGISARKPDLPGMTYGYLGWLTVADLGEFNDAPVVNAGTDILLRLPLTTTDLSGTASDADGILSTIQWTQLSGATTSISNDTTLTPTISGLVVGTFSFELTVTDDDGAASRDTVLVEVDYAGIARFNFSDTPDVIPGWNTLSGHPHAGMIDVTDAHSNIRVNNVAPDQWNPLSIGGGMYSTSYHGGVTNGTVQPPDVVYTYWFDRLAPYGSTINGVWQGDNIQILNLKPSTEYQLNLGASRITSASTLYEMEFRFNGLDPELLNVSNNATEEVFVTVESDQNGRIGISARRWVNSAIDYGYIGWLVVTEAGLTGSRAAGRADLDDYPTIAIYPNPANESVSLDLTGLGSAAVEVTLLDLSGNQLKSVVAEGGKIHELDVRGLPAGIYMVRIGNNRAVIIRKLIITR